MQRIPDLRAILLYHDGLSTRQISIKLGTSKSLVARDIRASGSSRSRSAANQLRQPPTSLHWRSSRNQARRVWERQVGLIPSGHHIHHKNGDWTDNRLANLECLLASTHAYRHRPLNSVPRHLRPGRKAYMKAYLAAYWKRRKEIAHAS
jgi:transposase